MDKNSKPSLQNLLLKRLVLLSAFIIIGISLFLTIVFNYFYQKYVFGPTFENIVSSVSSYIDQWQRTIKAFDTSYNPILKDSLNLSIWQSDVLNDLSDQQITEALTEKLANLSLQFVDRVNWYLINPGGVIERTDYLEDLGLDIAKAVPRYWAGRLEPLKVGESLIEGLSFEFRTNLPRIFGYKRLQNNWILEIGLSLDPIVVTDLWDGLKRIAQNNKYIEEIRLYGSSFTPFGNYVAVTDEEKEYFSSPEAENTFVVQNMRNSHFKVYKNWIPTTQGTNIDWSGKSAFFTLRVLMVLDFSKMESMKRSMIISLNTAITIAIILGFWISASVFRRISKPIEGLLKSIRSFQRSPLDVEDTSVESQVREISELEQSIQEMKEQIRKQMIVQYMTTERLKQDIEKYKYDIFFDPLTNLFNRRFLMKCLDDIQKNNSSIVVCFLDVDSFKSINDTYGHDVGDIVLKTLAERLQNYIRKKDLIFRIGGDEFVVLFFDLQVKEAEQVIERIQNSLEQIRFKDFPDLRISISYGFSKWSSEDKISIEDALKEADLQMYKKKFEKKN
ncbi:MAG TPA: GGDEF domain-containing protein [Pseudothermotoga sp.]